MRHANYLDKKLVILTTHFGNNFSGGSTATHNIFIEIQKKFDEIIVICNKVGRHSFKNIRFRKYNNIFGALWILNSFDNSNTLFYGDFYNSFWYVLVNKPFYFTYHDNWPEMAKVSLKYYLKSFYYNQVYKLIFRKAAAVIVVSNAKNKYVGNFTKKNFLVRNGFNKKKINQENNPFIRSRVLMVGNIENRKYRLAVDLFKKISKNSFTEFHIYGNIKDRSLYNKLKSFEFVKIMGFEKSIPYHKYICLLHTSMIENLPISLCESIFHLTPVIAFNVGGINEIINQSNGKLIKPFKIDEMINALKQIINEELLFSFKNIDLTEYDWSIAGEKYLKILK